MTTRFPYGTRIGWLLLLLSIPWTGALAQRSAPVPPPTPGPTPVMHASPVETHVLPNGMRVILLEMHEVPVVQFNVVVNAGDSSDAAEQYGLSGITADLLDEGAGNRSAAELADAFDFLGARFSIASQADAPGFQVYVPSARLKPAVDLLADVLLRPQLAPDAFARTRSEHTGEIVLRRDEPGYVADAILNQKVFGLEHPYAHELMLDTVSIASVQLNGVRDFYRHNYVPGNTTAIVVGDVTWNDLEPSIESAFGTWTGQTGPSKAITVPHQVEGTTIYLVNRPGSAQSAVRIGNVGPARSDGDFYAREVLNAILGGMFTSRLMQNLREQHGYTYGAGSTFEYHPSTGQFYMLADTNTPVTAPAITEMLGELRSVRDSITDEDVKGAREYLAARFAEHFQAVSDVAQMLKDVPTLGITPDEVVRYPERILNVTTADVREAAKRYLQPDQLAIVVVGDRQAIEQSLRDLQVGTVEVSTLQEAFDASGQQHISAKSTPQPH